MRFIWCGRLILGLVGISVTTRLPAQLSAAAGVGALAEQRATDVWQRSPTLRPTLRYDTPWSQFGLDGLATRTSDGLRMDRGLANAAVAPPPFGPFRVSATAQAERLAPAFIDPRTSFTLERPMLDPMATVVVVEFEGTKVEK